MRDSMMPGTEVEQLYAELAAITAERDALQRTLNLRNCALDAASSHFSIVDMQQPGMRLVYVNQAMAHDHGYSRSEDMIGISLPDLTVPELNKTQHRKIRDAIQAGQEVRTEIQGRRKDGSLFWAGIFMAPVRDREGKITHYLTLGKDITQILESERKKRELQDQLYNEMRERERMAIELRVAQKLESVGRLAAGIAHEINTPIQYVGDSVHFLREAVDGLQSLLVSYREGLGKVSAGTPVGDVEAALAKATEAADLEFLNAEIPQAFERTLEGVDRVSGIVRAMKEFAHPDSTEHASADINRALQTTLIVTRNEYKYIAQIESHFSELPPVVCNIGELNQVFVNLIVNAAHAIQASGKDISAGRITITTDAYPNAVHIGIGDNGCGIAHDNLDRIFDPFFTTKEVGKGTGQGLAIARSIVVDKHRGKINVHSAADIGTRFTIVLPIDVAATEQEAA